MKEQHVCCRRLTTKDGALYYRLLMSGYEVNKKYGVDFSASHSTEEEATQWIEENPTLGLFVDDVLVSSASLRMPWGSHPGPTPYPHIGHVVTDARWQGRGYARLIMRHIESWAREILCAPVVTLGTADTHPWLVDMYKSFGYEPFAKRKLEGKAHTTIYLQKQLYE